MARPEKLTDELTKQIAILVRQGNLPSVSASLCGISPSTYFNWMKRGREQEPRYLEFMESIERARSQGIVDRLAYIVRAAEVGHWRAAAWLLERTCPDEFGKRTRSVLEWDAPRRRQSNEISSVSYEELEDKVRRIKAMGREREEKIRVGNCQVIDTNRGQ